MVKRSRILAFFLIVIVLGVTFVGTTSNIMQNIKLGLDLQGGFEVLYKVEPAKDGQKIDEKAMAATASALDRRINVLGVSEPSIQVEGNNRIRVQLAGVDDQEKARELLSTQANLTFRDVNDKVRMDGGDLKEGGASQSFDSQTNQPIVQVQLKDADKFGQVTRDILAMAPENQLAIWLDFEEGKDSYKEEITKEDPKFISAPNVNQVINSDTAVISGDFTVEEAKDLAEILNAGALPVKLNEIYSTSVGAKFGEEALNKTLLAGIVGILAIFIFMVAYYRFPGAIAVVSLSAYIYLIILVFDWMNAVLTLPGIAALILGVGMAVDANIITNERIRDEIRKGRSIKAAYKEGNKHSLSTIMDANITTLLAAAVLFYFGTSSVKGFATSLIVSILVSFITAVYGTRLIMSLWVNSNFLNNRPGWFGVKKSDIHDLNEFKKDKYLPTKFDKWDFIKPAKKFFIFSIILTIIGVGSLFVNGLNTGIDFSSGSRIQINADKELSVGEIQKDLTENEIDSQDIVMAGEGNKSAVVRTKDVFSKDEIAELNNYFDSKYGHNPNISTVSPTIGKELAKNALIAVAIASIGIVIYATLRFEWRMALPSILALLHDAFMIITIFSIFRIEVDLTFIAAVLTIIGYSINDTIVTFDRIRENMQMKKRIKTQEEINEIINISVRQTMVRSINTVLTVLVTVLAMMFLGSESIFNFNLALLIGLVTGMYSSILLAAPIYGILKGKELKKKGVIKTYKEKRVNNDQPQV
ncbi:protein translocase subunit SecDF [Pradoshia sp. D12]|uniref:protein translocase subunit SecDF n=1 Tax=Bacillaceae TaxID=186817 RepID=UPI00112C3EDD|nr:MULTISPECIES: protein translocase subunit SecDF [Bacillaceae]QFK72318.1 protein translocase subunit SecDF [Pradoshia sp. D12]TPF71189.1 protein translocase subunit SecDF [Bacillus sp. D12]